LLNLNHPQIVNGCKQEDPDDTPVVAFDASSDLAALVSAGRELSPALQEAIDLHLAATLPDLVKVDVGLAAIGRGFVAFARCFWHLYLPNLPLDPAVGLRAHSGFISRQLLDLTSVYATLESAEAALTGNAQNPKMARIGEEIASLRQQLESAGVVPVTRESNPALLSGLFRELRSFQEQIISDAQLDALLDDLRNPSSPELSSREANLQRSIETLLRRLNLAYGDLGDILGPVRLALCSLKIGFSLLLHTSQSASVPSASTHFATLLHHLASFPTIAHSEAVESVDLPLSIKVGDAPLPPARATLLQVAALTGRLANNAVFDRDAAHRLTRLYDRLHYLWTADRRHEEEAAREAESLYRSKVDVQQVASDEELEAAEFAKLFPTFDEPTTNDDPKSTLPNGSTSTAPSRLLQSSDQATLAKLHVGIFAGGGAAFASVCASEFDGMRSASITTLLPKLFDSLDEVLDRDSAVYRIRSLVELSQAAAPSSDVEAPHHDFYNEPDVRETAKAVPILLTLSSRLADLIALWPDQMVLKNLRERCEAVLSLSSKSSIAQVLTALEQLLSHTEDWESYASREHSISSNRTSIINLIVEWRRFELTCWSRLLSTVQDRFGDPVAEWWFRFYETTIRGAPGVDVDPNEAPTQMPAEYYRDLVALLDSFLASSSLGQYRTRLQLVLSFANFAAKLGEKSADFEVSSFPTAVSIALHAHGVEFTGDGWRSLPAHRQPAHAQRPCVLRPVHAPDRLVLDHGAGQDREGRPEPHQARKLEGRERLRSQTERNSQSSSALQECAEASRGSSKACE
jgi:midasin